MTSRQAHTAQNSKFYLIKLESVITFLLNSVWQIQFVAFFIIFSVVQDIVLFDFYTLPKS